MRRSLYVLVGFSLVYAALAAPAPDPLAKGWGSLVNPDKDCKLRRDSSTLSIEMPGTDHDYDPLRKRLNAPRILREVEGEFDMQVRIRIDCPPSAKSTAKGHPPCVSAGFIMIFPETYKYNSICMRLDYGRMQQRIGIDAFAVEPLLAPPQKGKASRKGLGEDGYIFFKDWNFKEKVSDKLEVTIDRQRVRHVRPFLFDDGWRDWPMPKKADCVYLRIEQREKRITFFMSPDGEKWTGVMNRHPAMPAKSKVGLAAYTTSSAPSKVRFDRVRFTQGRKQEK